MNNPSLKEKFEKYLWWISPIVDLGQLFLWIVGLLISGTLFVKSIVFKQGVEFIRDIPILNIPPLSRVDSFFWTALFTLIPVILVTHFSWKTWRRQNNVFWFWFFIFFDMVAIWFFARYWLGNDWWIPTCIIPGLILFIIIGKVLGLPVDKPLGKS